MRELNHRAAVPLRRKQIGSTLTYLTLECNDIPLRDCNIRPVVRILLLCYIVIIQDELRSYMRPCAAQPSREGGGEKGGENKECRYV